MKKLLTLLLFLCSVCTFAQDVIVKKDGSTIVCRVVELTSSEVVYKKWTDLNGSNYVMNRSDASAINYQDGKKMGLSEASNLYAPNNQNDGVQKYNDMALIKMNYADKDFKKSEKRWRTIGIIGGITLISIGGLFSYNASHADDDATYDRNMAICGTFMVCGLIGGATCLLVAHNYHQKAKRLQASSIYQQEFKFKNGTSLSPSIDMLRDQAFHNQTVGVGLRFNF